MSELNLNVAATGVPKINTSVYFSHRFIAESKFFESFRVKKVSIEKLSYKERFARINLDIHFYPKLMSTIHEKKYQDELLVVKFLDPAGIVIGQVGYKIFEMDNWGFKQGIDYESGDPLVVTLSLIARFEYSMEN